MAKANTAAAKIKINTILAKNDDCAKKSQFIEVLRTFLQQHVTASAKKAKSSKKSAAVVIGRVCLLSNNTGLLIVIVDWLKSVCDELSESLRWQHWRGTGVDGGQRTLNCVSLCVDLLAWLYDDAVVEGLLHDCCCCDSSSGSSGLTLGGVRQELEAVRQILRGHAELPQQLLDAADALTAVASLVAVPVTSAAPLTLIKLGQQGTHFSALSGKGSCPTAQVQMSVGDSSSSSSSSAEKNYNKSGTESCGSDEGEGEGEDVSALLRKRKLAAISTDKGPTRAAEGAAAARARVRNDCLLVRQLFPLLLAQLSQLDISAKSPAVSSRNSDDSSGVTGAAASCSSATVLIHNPVLARAPIAQVPGRASIQPAWMTQTQTDSSRTAPTVEPLPESATPTPGTAAAVVLQEFSSSSPSPAVELLDELPAYLEDLSEDQLAQLMNVVSEDLPRYLAKDGLALRALVDAVLRGDLKDLESSSSQQQRSPSVLVPVPTINQIVGSAVDSITSCGSSSADQADAFLASLGQVIAPQLQPLQQEQHHLEVAASSSRSRSGSGDGERGISAWSTEQRRQPTIPCRHFQRTGRCKFGDQCTFLHELLQRPHQSGTSPDDGHCAKALEDGRGQQDSPGYATGAGMDGSDRRGGSAGVKVLNAQEIYF